MREVVKRRTLGLEPMHRSGLCDRVGREGEAGPALARTHPTQLRPHQGPHPGDHSTPQLHGCLRLINVLYFSVDTTAIPSGTVVVLRLASLCFPPVL